MHSVAPVESEYRPAGHASHIGSSPAPTAEKLPIGHCTHCSAPLTFENMPGGHGAQAAAPGAGWYVDGAQAVQLAAPGAPAKVPGSHASQPSIVVPPTAWRAVPAGHLRHDSGDGPPGDGL